MSQLEKIDPKRLAEQQQRADKFAPQATPLSDEEVAQQRIAAQHAEQERLAAELDAAKLAAQQAPEVDNDIVHLVSATPSSPARPAPPTPPAPQPPAEPKPLPRPPEVKPIIPRPPEPRPVIARPRVEPLPTGTLPQQPSAKEATKPRRPVIPEQSRPLFAEFPTSPSVAVMSESIRVAEGAPLINLDLRLIGEAMKKLRSKSEVPSDAELRQVEALLQGVAGLVEKYRNQNIRDSKIAQLQSIAGSYTRTVTFMRDCLAHQNIDDRRSQTVEDIDNLHQFIVEEKAKIPSTENALVARPEITQAYELLLKDSFFGPLLGDKVAVQNNLWKEATRPKWSGDFNYLDSAEVPFLVETPSSWNRDRSYTSSPELRLRVARYKELTGNNFLSEKQVGQLLFLRQFGYAFHSLMIQEKESKLAEQQLPAAQRDEAMWKAVQPSEGILKHLTNLIAEKTPESDAIIQGLFQHDPKPLSPETALRLRLKELAAMRLTQAAESWISTASAQGVLAEQQKTQKNILHQIDWSEPREEETVKLRANTPSEVFADAFAVAMMKRFGLDKSAA